MKAGILAFFVFLSGSAAMASTAEMSCLEILALMPNENDQIELVPTSASIEIVKSPLGDRGWIGEVTSKGQIQKMIESDVDVTVEAPSRIEDMREVVEMVVPGLEWSKIASVKLGTVGVRANQEDGGGMTIIELRASDETVLAKVVQIGWGFGVCR